MKIHFKEATQITRKQKEKIIILWNTEYPINLKHSGVDSFDAYLSALKKKRHLLIVNDQNDVLGWYMDFDRDEERWFVMILDISIQGKGIGSKILKKAKTTNDTLSGWVTDHDQFMKEDGSFYKSPIHFYTKNGFTIYPEITLRSEKLSAVKIRWQK